MAVSVGNMVDKRTETVFTRGMEATTTTAKGAQAMTTTIELGSEVTYQGRKGEVTGFGSLAASVAEYGLTTERPSAFVVQVAMAPFGIVRTLSLGELAR